MRTLRRLLRSRRVGAIGLVASLLLVTVTGLAYALPSQAARGPSAHSKHALPTPAHVATPPSSASDWPMYGNNPALTGVNAGEALLTPYTVRGLGLSWRDDVGPTCPGCNVEQVYGSPTVVGGVVYVNTSALNVYLGSIYAFDELSGRLLWGHTILGEMLSSPTVVNGVVYFTNSFDGGMLYALNATTGAPLWTYPCATSNTCVSPWASPIVVNGVVYVGSAAVNATTGKLLWINSVFPGDFPFTSAVVNGMVYGVSDNGGRASPDGRLSALTTTTGAVLWTYQDVNVKFRGTPAVANGVVYASTQTGVYAVNATTGAKVWGYDDGVAHPSPIVANGVVYVGSLALDATTGAPLWSISANSVAMANGVLYALAGNSLYALDASTGAGLWSYTTGDTNRYFSSLVVANGMVFAFYPVTSVTSTYAGLYAFQPAIRPLTTTH
jgi:outer membrane protein assembly factor BamB